MRQRVETVGRNTRTDPISGLRSHVTSTTQLAYEPYTTQQLTTTRPSMLPSIVYREPAHHTRIRVLIARVLDPRFSHIRTIFARRSLI